MTLAHTPFDGSSKPFTIGVSPLDPTRWIEIDEHFEAYLTEKQRLFQQRAQDVFAAETDTLDAQREVHDLIRDHLASQHPDVGPRTANPDDPPLKSASLLVQEDLVLMRKGVDGWRLAAAALCFPSSWTLSEKFGRPLVDIHEPVPQFGRDTRNAALIERMFDNLKDQLVIRWNWSLQKNPDLYHPLSHTQLADRDSFKNLPFSPASTFIRVERQTLRKLPLSGDILFTIRIHLDPLRALAAHPDCKNVASAFAEQLEAMDPRQLAYKGLRADRDELVKTLRALAAG